MFTLKNRVKTHQRNYPSNVTIFRTLDRNFVRSDLGIMLHLSKIRVRILRWDPWLPICIENLARLAMAAKMLVRGSTWEGV